MEQFPALEIKEASTKSELVSLLISNSDALVIVDYTLFDFESVNELHILQTRFEQTDWIVFSDELSDDFIYGLLYNTHSFSILFKDSSREEINSALKEAYKGSRYICNRVSNLLLDNSVNRNKPFSKQVLTQTEQEILKEIMTHRKNIFRKIEVNNVHEATKYAMRAGIVDMAEYYI
jgi:DNA-binding NarL/FixJ family response regulator